MNVCEPSEVEEKEHLNEPPRSPERRGFISRVYTSALQVGFTSRLYKSALQVGYTGSLRLHFLTGSFPKSFLKSILKSFCK